jgi:hypothetical protein
MGLLDVPFQRANGMICARAGPASRLRSTRTRSDRIVESMVSDLSTEFAPTADAKPS